MARAPKRGNLYVLFTFDAASSALPSGEGSRAMVVGIAVAMFIALFGWGSGYFGWTDPNGKVQLALATSFILGIIGGYRAKGD